MPELPEVQTVVNDLQKIIRDKIIDFWSDFPKGIKTKKFAEDIKEKKITTIFRGGKNIIIELENKSAIIAHLKMTGQILLEDHAEKNDRQKYSKHIHHVFYLKKQGRINFSDIRKFGTLELVDEITLKKILEAKGLDPISSNYTFENFIILLQKSKKMNLKQFLMDQSLIAGIGNIYASEIPFDVKISPLRKIDSLTAAESKKLFTSIKKILEKAIKLRGTSFSDYRDSKGKKGAFQNFLKVYKKNGQKCKKCDTMVEKIIIGQRSTFYCPKCQK
jgi:formamidopyrimidine-DNA glycosylase